MMTNTTGSQTTSTMLDNSDPAVYAENFAKSKIVGMRYLALRDIPQLIEEYVTGTTALDYGCGAAISTTVVKSLGLRVDGVDVNEKMIEKAKERDPGGCYYVIESGKVPVADAHYDLVFSCLVFMYVSTKAELVNIFEEVARILKPDGCLIAVVPTDTMYNADWTTVNTQFAENENLRSGAPVKALLKDVNLLVHHYFWSEDDYREVCDQSGLTIVKAHRPLGRSDDGFEWAGEETIPTVLIFVIQKRKS